MISASTYEKLKEILKRIAHGGSVTLSDRIYIQDIADSNERVSSWLKRARRLQQGNEINDEIDKLIYSLDLGFSDPQSEFNPEKEDLGDWFIGAPKWLGRS